jgi:hypothetical protein
MSIAEWREAASLANALEFAIPVLLSIGFLPFLYVWRAYAAYNDVFVTLSVFGLEKGLVPYARWLALTRIGDDLALLERWRRTIQQSRPANRQELKHSLTALLALKVREASPPVVPAEHGWSPYLAMQFMSDLSFDTGHYHCAYDDEWFASSPMREIGNAFPFANNIAFYVEGSEHAANVVKLKLNVNVPTDPQEAEDHFIVCCMHLLEQAVSLDAVERMKLDIAALRDFGCVIPFGSVLLTREDFVGGIEGGYSRKFEVRRG